MTTKVFPTVNDVGGAGSGKTMTEKNLIAWLKSLVNQNFIITGFVPPASSASLTLAIPAGQALLDGHFVDIDTATNVTCTASSTNHIYLKLTKDASQNVTGASFEVNTTGTAPADSVKICTAVTSGSAVTSTTDVRVFNTPQVGGLRNLLDPATQKYTGASVRYKKDGTQVPANTLRLEQGKFGQMPFLEEAMTNIVLYSDPTALAQLDPYSNVTIATVGAVASYFQGGVVFGDNTLLRYAGQRPTLAITTTYCLSVFIRMDDGGVPVVGANSGAGDFCLIIANALVSTNLRVDNLGGGLYRVSGTYTTPASVPDSHCAVYKYTTQSARSFKCSGIDVEAKSYPTSYMATTGATASRTADKLYYTLAQPLPKQNFGALVWTPEQGSTSGLAVRYLMHAENSAGVRRYKLSFGSGYFELGKYDGTSWYNVTSSTVTFSASDRVFVAWLDDPITGNMKLWVGVNNGTITEYTLADTIQITDAIKVFIGCYATAGYECSGTIDFPIISDALPTSAQVKALYHAQDWGGMRNYPGIISAETKTPAGDTIFTDAGGTLKGALNMIDANRRLRRPDATNLGLNLESDNAALTLSGRITSDLAANARYDGSSGGWNRIDTGQPAMLIRSDGIGGQPLIYTAPIGANPISWSGPYNVHHDGDLRTWGSVARMQGIMVMATGTVTDDGAGLVTLGAPMYVINPAAGSFVRVASGAYTLGTWGYLYIDLPPTSTRGTTLTPQVGVWSDADRTYDHKDRIILAQRVSNTAVLFNGSFQAKLFGTVPDADTLDTMHANAIALFFGAGTDGDVIISANTTLTRDMYYNNLTVDNGFTLNTAGFRVFVKGTLLNNGTIAHNGSNGGNGSNDVGGASGAGAPTGTLLGGGGGGGGTTGGLSGGQSSNITWGLGGVGGTTPQSNAAGSVTAPPATSFNIKEYPDNVLLRAPLAVTQSGASLYWVGGGTGGTGGCSWTAPAAGGGGGGAGGILLLVAFTLTNNGTIKANGGNGGNAGGTSGSAYGGSGGGGGAIVLLYHTKTAAGTTQVAAGTGGTQYGGKSDGVSGSAGNIYEVVV